MSNSQEYQKGWNWNTLRSVEDKKQWLTPSLEAYSFLYRWKEQGKDDFLDLGCGIGRHALIFGKQGFSVYFSDIKSEAVEQTESLLKKENIPCFGRVEDMENMSFDDNSFDCILSWQVINHNDTKGVKKTISEIHRILKPNGEVALTIPSKKTWGFKQDWPVVDENTKLNMANPAENQVPHFYADYALIKELFKGFELLKVDEVCQCKQFESGRENLDTYKFIILACKKMRFDADK